MKLLLKYVVHYYRHNSCLVFWLFNGIPAKNTLRLGFSRFEVDLLPAQLDFLNLPDWRE